jgi:hypothetical protein
MMQAAAIMLVTSRISPGAQDTGNKGGRVYRGSSKEMAQARPVQLEGCHRNSKATEPSPQDLRALPDLTEGPGHKKRGMMVNMCGEK